MRPLAAGDPPTPITVFGKAFQPDSTIHVTGTPIPTTYRSAEEMHGTIPAHLLAVPRELTVEVRTPGPGGGISLAGRVSVATSVFPGRFVVFTSNRRGGRNHLYLLDRQRSALDPLEEANSANANDGYPSISADGRFIVFQSDRHRGQEDVFLFDRERRVLDALPEANHPTAFDGFPAISADGRFIVFESDRLGGKLKLFLFDLQGRAPLGAQPCQRRCGRRRPRGDQQLRRWESPLPANGSQPVVGRCSAVSPRGGGAP